MGAVNGHGPSTQGVRVLHSVALNLEGMAFLAGWRPDAGTIFLPALSEARVGDEVAVRVGIFGRPMRATLFGSVSLVRRVGRPSLPPGIDLALERGSLPAAHYLATAARGEAVTFRERGPRYLVSRPLLVDRGGGPAETRTLNVSENGCAVGWSGPLPQVGEVVGLKVGDGFFAQTARAIVCWNAAGGTLERSAGLRIIAEGRAARAWRSFAAAAARNSGKAA